MEIKTGILTFIYSELLSLVKSDRFNVFDKISLLTIESDATKIKIELSMILSWIFEYETLES